MLILKEEINQATAEILSLAKWKLVVVGATAVAGLGWSDVRPDSQSGLLLTYSVGFVCAYVDWLCYRRLTVIHTIASYLRDYTGDDPETLELGEYERAMAERRGRRTYFLSETWASFAATMVFTLGLPFIAMQAYGAKADFRLAIVASAVALNVVAFFYYRSVRGHLLDKPR